MSVFTPGNLSLPPGFFLTPFTYEMAGLSNMPSSQPASGSMNLSGQARFMPIYLSEPFPVSKIFWVNGSTVGTDTIDIGAYLMTDFSTSRLDLIRSCGPVLSAGANAAQETATWRVAAGNLTTGVDSTDATSYTTASVNLKAGRCYLLSFVNTAASAGAISSISGGPTWTSRSSTQYNGTAHRVSIWSGVPTSDYVGTLVVDFGASTQTSGRWSLNEFSGVDTATDDGIVQQATNTGSSVSPSATLGAFSSSNNATFGAIANTSDSTTTPGTGFTELSDLTTSTTPASFLQTQWRVDNDTTVDGTISNNAWGVCAVELKADTVTPFVIPPSLPGSYNVYMGITVSGTTATLMRGAPAPGFSPTYITLANQPSLPPSCIPIGQGTIAPRIPLAGFSLRSLVA